MADDTKPKAAKPADDAGEADEAASAKQPADAGEVTPAKQPADDAGEAEVAEKMAEEQDQGFRGIAVDETPNENYTIQGQAAGKPTPETEA